MSIAEKFPELSKYIGEMPVKISYVSGSGINIKTLKDYYASLQAVFEKYTTYHNNTIKSHT